MTQECPAVQTHKQHQHHDLHASCLMLVTSTSLHAFHFQTNYLGTLFNSEHFGMFSVSAEGSGGDPSGCRSSERHPVPAEVYPGGKSYSSLKQVLK